MNMRIAYVINSLEGGGAASPVPAITRVIKSAGAEVKVFALTRRDGRALDAMLSSGLDVLVRDGGEKDHMSAIAWLDRELRAWGATHIWTSLTRSTLLGQLVGARRGLPVVSWQHNAFLKPWNERLLRLMRNRAKIWVADSHMVAELTRQRLKLPSDRVITWPIFFADPDAPHAEPWQTGETLQLGSLGRLHPAKGYDVLIAALLILKADSFSPPVPFHITIAGEGAEKAALERAAADAGIANLTFSGFAAEPRLMLAGLHLYLQPSRREGFCIAAHEGMQAGLPVIVSAVGEMPQTVSDDRYGRVVQSQDPKALAAALRDLLMQPEQLAHMGIAARGHLLNRFSWERFEKIGLSIVAQLADTGSLK